VAANAKSAVWLKNVITRAAFLNGSEPTRNIFVIPHDLSQDFAYKKIYQASPSAKPKKPGT
jgi:hypothetical protein